MDCTEARELISPAVDERLGETSRRGFETHIAECPECRNEFELERLTKSYVRQTLHRSGAPAPFSARLLSRLERTAQTAPSPFLRLRIPPRWKPAIAASLVVVAAITLFLSLPINVRHLHTSPDDNNVIHQSFNNYDAFVAGTMTPQLVSNDPAEVKSYFARRVDYTVRVPQIEKCRLLGGLVSDFHGKPLAHVVYQRDDQVLYLYQVDLATVLRGATLTIPDRARDELLRTGWFVESPHPKCSLVMWVVDNTLCTAVADMDKNELIASLTYSHEE